MTTCSNCGKEFADNVLHLCLAGNIWPKNAVPAVRLEVRGQIPNDTASATGGLEIRSGNVELGGGSFGPPTLTPPAIILDVPGIGIGCTNPPAGCLEFRLDDGRRVVYYIDDVIDWAAGDMSSIKPGNERLAIMLLARVATLSLQLARLPSRSKSRPSA